MLPRLPFARRGRGGRAGDVLCGGRGLDSDPFVQLFPDPGVLRAMNTTPVPKIAVRGVKKSFGRKRVLDGIEIACGAGESLVIIGGSGTGKSVLIKCILGLLRPDSGSIRVDGEETTGIARSARERLMLKFGMLFQGSALFDSLSVWENF